MSNNKTTKNFDHNRRNFIKSAAYISALSIGGLSSLAFATNHNSAVLESAANKNVNSANGIRIIQETLFDRESVTLINETGKLQQLDARQPISLHQVTGMLIVTVNQNDANAVNGMVLMSPNERFTFDVKAIGIDIGNVDKNTIDTPALTNLAENKLQITSEHSVFNRILPVELA